MLTSKKQALSEWEELSGILSGITGRYTSPPPIETVITNGYTSGQLLANGDLSITSDGRDGTQTYYIAKSDFWAPSSQKLTFGSVSVKGPNSGTEAQPDPDYLQEQDILNAEVRSTMRIEGELVHMRTWLAASENLLVTELRTNPNARAIPIQVELAVPDNPGYPYQSGTEDGIIWVTRTSAPSPEDHAWFSLAAAAARVVGADAVPSVPVPGSSFARFEFELTPGQPVQVYTVIQGDGRPYEQIRHDIPHYLNSVKQRVEQLIAEDVAQLHQEHLDWWKEFWLKSYVKLNDEVLEKYYYGALYALGAAVRESFLPPGAYSSWNNNDTTGPLYGSGYYLNFNYEAAFYGVFSGNRPELANAYYPPIMAEIPFQRNATAKAGYKGVSFCRSFRPMRIYNRPPEPLDIADTKDYSKLPADQKTNGTFAALPFLWRYQYMYDVDFFRSVTYPFLKELAEFWMDYLEKGEDGYYDVLHTGVNEGGDDINPTYDLGLIRSLFQALIKGSRDLQVDADLIPVWQEVLDHLTPYPRGEMDGKEVFLLAEEIHNHIKGNALINKSDQPIMLEGVVHPSDNLAIGSDPELLQVARNTLEYINPFEPGVRGSSLNGFPKTFTIAARVGWDPEDLIGKFKTVINHLWRENLTVRQSGGGLETSGSIETIHSMFLQTNDDTLRVFPNWPQARDAKFVRLRAKGAFVLSSELKDGRVTHVQLTSDKGRLLRLVNPWGQQPIRVVGEDGAPVEHTIEDGVILLSTSAGATYTFTADSK
ncbi:hypothetical protein ACFQ88_27075 [Paenibacillus sp. NPDC056579]|uniref:glycosyl hydrolase family 95 catalytic domain-containing protein n=1 Tax=Paenibacillus sp. NPDC056579 TaxID=3345871 RepID=UPI0036C704C2